MELPLYLFLVALWTALSAYWMYVLGLVICSVACGAYCSCRCGGKAAAGAWLALRLSVAIILTALVLLISFLMANPH